MKNNLLSKRIFPARFAKQAIIFTLLTINFIFPQVVIEERVEINGSQSENNLKRNSEIVYTDSGFIMWKSGHLQVNYNSHESYLYHYDGPMPDYSSLNTYFLKDNSMKIDSLLPRFPLLTVNTLNLYNFCNSSYIERTKYFYDRQTPGLFDLGYVEEGDTVQFSYYSDIVGSGTPYTYVMNFEYEISEGWVFDVYQVDSCFQTGVNGLSIVVNIVGGLDHFEVTIVPDTLSEQDTLAFSETARLYIQAKDSENNDIDLTSDTLLTFKVETNENYGTFIDANGDTLKTTPVILNDITYGDANEGLIKFAAVKENPDSFVTCRVKVCLQEDTTKNGEREAVVLEQTLKIVIVGDYVIEPIITRRGYDPEDEEDTYLNNIGVENRKPFRVKLTRGDVLVRNHSIKLMTDYVDGSGGHDHVNPRRPDSAFTYQRTINGDLTTINVPTDRARKQNYGSFYSYSSGETFNVDSLKGMIYERSSQDTVTRFEYVASIWGDQMKIYLRSLENSSLNKDSVVITERIADLEELLDGESYDLIGGTINHTIEHNHFGAADVIQDIVQIANDWHNEFPNELILQINDISLPNGGKFDHSSLSPWRGPHADHREGRDIDIRTDLYFYNIQGQLQHRIGVPVRYPRDEPFNTPGGGLNPNSTLVYDLDFERICRTNNGRARIHNDNTTNEHYHIDFDN